MAAYHDPEKFVANSDPFLDNGAEPEPKPVDLTEQRIAEVHDRLVERFADPDCPDFFRLPEVPGMLGTSSNSLSIAIHDSKLFTIGSSAKILLKLTGTDPKPTLASEEPTLSQKDLLELNRHPFTHTKSVAEISEGLAIPPSTVWKVVKNGEIKPVRAPANSPNFPPPSEVLLDLNHAAAVETAVKALGEPPGLVSTDDVLQRLEIIGPEFFAQVVSEIQIPSQTIFSPGLGREREYFTPEDAATVIRGVVARRSIVPPTKRGRS